MEARSALASHGPVTTLDGTRSGDRARRSSRDAARVIHDSAGRRDSTPVRKSFVRSIDQGSAAPLFRLYRGGRSGVVAIRLYLALLWRNASPPFESDKTYEGWATLLDLDDPGGRGARRVAHAVKRLEEEQLIKVTPQAGHPPVLTLVREDGSGRPYTHPGGAYARAVKNRRGEAVLARHRYFKVNSQLWNAGVLQVLSGSALVMLLILLAEQGGEGEEVWFSVEAFDAWYGLSRPKRTQGIEELKKRHLVRVTDRSLGSWAGASVYEPKRKRHVYTLQGAALAPALDPPEATVGTATRRTGRRSQQ